MLAICLLLTSCEKFVLDDTMSGSEKEACNVVLQVGNDVQEDFDIQNTQASRSMQPISKICSKISCTFFDGETKVKNLKQTIDEEGFGTIKASLPKGNYQVVIIAHNGSGPATISTTEKVTFSNNKLTDTFYYYGTLSVGDEEVTEDISLKRNVAMFRLNIEGNIPASAKKIKFYYTGGSSTFSPSTGYGCVNSRQTEIFDLKDGQNVYEVYSFPHEESDALKMTITVLNGNEEELLHKELTNVPIKINHITSWTTELFSNVPDTGNTNNEYTLQADDEWDDTITFTP